MVTQSLKLSSLTFAVPKSRKPRFDLSLRIADLNNIPLVTGTAFVKWHLPSSSGAEHRGRTDKAHIKDHKATWNYSKELTVRLTIDKAQGLQECEIHFEIVQEYFAGTRGGRVVLGNVRLNLAEYTRAPEELIQPNTDKEEDEEGVIIRRYLMQDSKVNATLKVGIRMKQTEGDLNYIPPPLKSAMVIGGIAGIMNAEAGESEEMPSISAKTRELAEAQDIYRRTLAATWACQYGELPPDRLIEDIFAGGDGGRMAPPPPPHKRGHSPRHMRNRDSIDSNASDSHSSRTISQSFLDPESARIGHRRNRSSGLDSEQHHAANGNISGRGSIEQQLQLSQSHRRKAIFDFQEPTEFDLRDDLRSWQIHVR